MKKITTTLVIIFAAILVAITAFALRSAMLSQPKNSDIKYVIFFGRAASGKGSQGDFAIEKFHMARISSGETMRKLAKSSNPEEASKWSKILERVALGNMISFEDATEIMKISIASSVEKLNKSKVVGQKYKGIILDGYPRSIRQNESIEAGDLGDFEISAAFFFDISEKDAIDRMSGRLVCGKCGENYGKSKKPKEAGKCDKCGEKISRRKDDSSADAIRKRFKTFDKETMPVIEFYKKKGKLITIDAALPMEEVWSQTEKHLEKILNG